MKNNSTWWIRVPVIFFVIFGLVEYFIDSGEKPAFIEYPIITAFMGLVLLILIAMEIILQAIENVMFNTLNDEAQKRYLERKSKKWEWTWGKNVYTKLLGSKPVEEEGEIILDHNYDGIRELDNDLPPWWVYMFYATAIFAIVYLVRFEVLHDYTQAEEFEQDMAEARAEVEAYKRTAKGLVDANTVELLTDAGDLSAGKVIYEASCVACHMADGGGGIGPNLADANWILGGGIKNVFNTVSEGGRDGKGMVAWKQILKPLEMAQVSSYILTEINGKMPANPKAVEGDIWVDPDAPARNRPVDAIPEQASDTISAVNDSKTVTVN